MMTIKSQERLLDFSRSISYLCSHKDFTYPYWSGCWQHRYCITKVGHWRKDVLEVHAPFCCNFFLQKIFPRLTSLFFNLYLHLKTLEKCFFLRRRVIHRDIIFRDRTYLVFCFIGCVVKFQAREAKNWPRSASSNPGNRACVLVLFLFFLFLPLLAFFLLYLY